MITNDKNYKQAEILNETRGRGNSLKITRMFCYYKIRLPEKWEPSAIWGCIALLQAFDLILSCLDGQDQAVGAVPVDEAVRVASLAQPKPADS